MPMPVGISAPANAFWPPELCRTRIRFSFSRTGAEWFAWEWAVDALSGALHRALGLAGVAWFYGLTIGASVWMWFRLAWKAGGNFLLVCAFAAPMLSTTNLHWLARPSCSELAFPAGCGLVCERGIVERRDLLTAFFFAAAWANVHGSFFLRCADSRWSMLPERGSLAGFGIPKPGRLYF